jgi:hypothetical protein
VPLPNISKEPRSKLSNFLKSSVLLTTAAAILAFANPTDNLRANEHLAPTIQPYSQYQDGLHLVPSLGPSSTEITNVAAAGEFIVQPFFLVPNGQPDFTEQEKADLMGELAEAGNWWEENVPANQHLDFGYLPPKEMRLGTDPLQYPATDLNGWFEPAFLKILAAEYPGYQFTDINTALIDLGNHIRDKHGVDGAITPLIVKGDSFEDGWGAFAYINFAPIFITTEPFGDSLRFLQVYRHELGHNLGAVDLYFKAMTPCGFVTVSLEITITQSLGDPNNPLCTTPAYNDVMTDPYADNLIVGRDTLLSIIGDDRNSNGIQDSVDIRALILRMIINLNAIHGQPQLKMNGTFAADARLRDMSAEQVAFRFSIDGGKWFLANNLNRIRTNPNQQTDIQLPLFDGVHTVDSQVLSSGGQVFALPTQQIEVKDLGTEPQVIVNVPPKINGNELKINLSNNSNEKIIGYRYLVKQVNSPNSQSIFERDWLNYDGTNQLNLTTELKGEQEILMQLKFADGTTSSISVNQFSNVSKIYLPMLMN